ncbi:MAG: hypothetical protein ACR2GH_02860 [Pseudonocardia sp.]
MPVDRTGNPDDLLDRTDAAKLLGYSDPNVIDSYRSRDAGYFPDPRRNRPVALAPRDPVDLRRRTDAALPPP